MKIYTYEGKANISGDRIHQARTAQRLSQDALAAKLQLAGLSIGREAVSRIETGLRFVTDYELVIFARYSLAQHKHPYSAPMPHLPL